MEYHPTYPSVLWGEYFGDLPQSVPAPLLLRKFFAKRRADATPTSSDQYSLSRQGRKNTIEDVDEQMIEEVNLYLELQERAERENFIKNLPELRKPKNYQEGYTFNKTETVPAGEIGINEALQDGKFLKSYDSNVASEMIKNIKDAKAGSTRANALINASVPEGTKVGIRLNLNSSIPNMSKGLDKLQTIHKET